MAYAGFRHGADDEREVGTREADDERPDEVVIVNPVSRLWMHCGKQAFSERWQKA